MTGWDVEIFVFSYERGAYLENFLRSVREVGWRGDVTVVDDGSSGFSTLRVLKDAEEAGVTVVRRPHSAASSRGGLRANMQWALDAARGAAVLFAQDDMQLVRRVEPEEEALLTSVVSDGRNAPLLFPAFHLRGWKASKRAKNYRFDERLGMPTRTLFHPLPGFSDVAVFQPERLRAAGFEYTFEESGSSVLSYRLFGPMISYPYPFLAFLPSPPVPRLGRRHRILHPQRRATPAVLRSLSDSAVRRLFERDPSDIPFVDDWLEIRSQWRQLALRRTGWVG